MADIQVKASDNSFRELCPYCHSRFSEHEDLVFCFRCEAKHHEECWTELGCCSACRNEDSVQDLSEPEIKVLAFENLEDGDVEVVKKRRVREKGTNSMAFGLILIIVICAMIPIGFLLLVAAMF